MSRLLQVVLAIVGLVLTVVLQQASNRQSQVQNAQGLVQLYTQEVAAALQTCNLPMLQVAQNTATELNDLRALGILKSKTDFERHVIDVGETIQACAARDAAVQSVATAMTPTDGAAPAPPSTEDAPVAAELMAQSRNLELRGAELRSSQASVSDNLSRGAPETAGRRIFAVLASYAVSTAATYDERLGAAAHYNQLATAARAAGLEVQVYRTRISNHFAIVVPAASEQAARDVVTQARTGGWASDAFVQAERNWVQCSEPSTPQGLRACAGDAVRQPTRGPLRAPD